ncbi:TolC family protein [Poseidonibacter sp.]|uniref:TolC family protein n=1 Tax=Poseidonibacter sp. TaxID=2321188 RepID=UPI003C7756CE
MKNISILNLFILLFPLVLFSAEDKISQSVYYDEVILEKENSLNQISGVLDTNISIKSNEIPNYVNVAKKDKSYINSEEMKIDDYEKVKLVDVVLETLSHSDLLKSAREKVIQSELKLKNALAGYYPTLNFEYTLSRTRSLPGTDEKRFKFYNNKNYEFVMRQNLYSGGATYYEIYSVQKTRDVTQNQYIIVLNEEIKKAIKAYFGVVFANRSVMVNERNIKKLNKIMEIATIKYDSGALSLGDITSIKASAANAKTKLLKVKSKFLEALRYYEYIAGTKFIKTLPYEKDFDIDITDFEDLYSRALVQNKNLINYYRSIESQKYKLKASHSAFKPKVDFELSYDNVLDKEDFEDRETNVTGQVRLSYNLYNGGRDKNKLLKINSEIRDLNYRVNEEIKKLKWNLSKLYTSVLSVKEALKSNVVEIQASRKMVKAYWEAFELGEQDLQVLLTGQRQLNTAELDLVKYEETYINSFFNILELSGDLSSFFDVDPENPKFIDFSKSDYRKSIYANTDILKNNTNSKKEKTNSIKTPKTSVSENINTFIKEFLEFDEESYSIEISPFNNIYEAFDFIEKNKIDKKSFYYDMVNKYEIHTKIAHGNFKTLDDANKEVKILEEKFTDKKFTVKKVKDIKKLYDEYIKGLVVKVNIPKPKVKIQIKEKIIEKIRQVKKEKVFQTNEVFKDKFLLADDKSFTINISSFTTLKDLEVLVKKYKLEENSFFFNYGDNTKLIKLVYGVFDTYEKANNKLKDLSELKGTYFPIIERIASVKNLYNENIELNTKVEKKLEYEYIDLSSLENKEEIKINTSERLNKLDESEYKALEVNVESIVENKVNNQISSSFKERFLATPRNHYTINLASFENISIANEFIEKHNLFDEVFYVYTSKGKVKLMYKIFSTFKDISLAVKNLPDSLRRNNPFIQKIHRSQDLYVKNNAKWE